jgi:cytochrome c biogenesis protein CcmG/thiol:disulfide interchange protein DsbE
MAAGMNGYDVEANPSSNGSRLQGRKRMRMFAGAAVVTGAILGVAVGRLASPNGSGGSTSNVFTATGGVFTKEAGIPAPTWNLPDLAHRTKSVALSQFRGHPLIINFWASWCPPCRAEMPALEHEARKLAGRITIVGLDTQDEASAGLAFARSRGVSYPLALDNAQVWSAYGVYGLPTTFFVSANGRIVGKQTGGMTQSRLETLIHQVFGIASRNVN